MRHQTFKSDNFYRVMCNFPREVKLTMGPSLCSDNRFCLDVQVLQCGWIVDDYTPSPSTCPPSCSIVHRRHRLSMSPIALLTSHRSPNNSWSLPQVVSLSWSSVSAVILSGNLFENLVPWSIWPLSGNYTKLCQKFSDLNIWCLILKWKGVSFNPYLYYLCWLHILRLTFRYVFVAFFFRHTVHWMEGTTLVMLAKLIVRVCLLSLNQDIH